MTAEPKARTVAVDAVVEMEETRTVRARHLDTEHVHRMVPFVGELPPIDVVALAGHTFGVLAGYHRLAAHRQAERKTIKVLVHELPIEEWFAFGVRSNIAHGLPLTLAERKTAARKMIANGDRRSDRAIAADCGLDHKTVGKLRMPDDDDPTGENPQLPQGRIGIDGKVRRIPKPSKGAHDSRLSCGDLAELSDPYDLIAEASKALDYGLDNAVDKILAVIETEVWRSFTTPMGRPVVHESFAEFVTAKQLDGLNSDLRTVENVCRGNRDAMAALEKVLQRDPSTNMAAWPDGSRLPSAPFDAPELDERSRASIGPRGLKPFGTVEWCWQTANLLQTLACNLEANWQDVRSLLDELERAEAWTKIPPEHPYGSFEALVQAEIGTRLQCVRAEINDTLDRRVGPAQG